LIATLLKSQIGLIPIGIVEKTTNDSYNADNLLL
jgi:hypothetical protein